MYGRGGSRGFSHNLMTCQGVSGRRRSKVTSKTCNAMGVGGREGKELEGRGRQRPQRPSQTLVSYLIEPRRKEVTRRQDAAVGAEVVLLHHVLVLDLRECGGLCEKVWDV